MSALTSPIMKRSEVAAVLRFQQALAPAGRLDGVSIYVKTPEGNLLSVVEDGQASVPGERARGNGAMPAAGALCLVSDEGEQVYVRDERGGHATAALVAAVLRASLRATEADQREELLLEELGANWESLDAFYEISTDVLRSGNIKDALKRLLSRLTALQDGLRSALYINREGTFHPLVSTETEVKSLASTQLGIIEKCLLEMRVVLAKQPTPVPDPRACWRLAASLAAAPFSWQGSVGFVVVWCEDRICEFDSTFSRMLEAITYQASVMMESDRLSRKVRESQLLAQEVEIASSIQQTLLLANAPRDVPALEMAACSVPSQQIDGDFHDFFQHPDGTVDVLLGDVMGKGVAAALLGAATKSQVLRATANLALRFQSGPPRPADIITRAASRLTDRLISLDRFVTLCYARFDVGNNTLSFVDCGHTSMIRENKALDTCTFLSGADLPLGVLPDYRCEEHSCKVHPGDTYLLYSDGVTESRSPEGELFGAERLAECVQNWSTLGPALLVEQIRKEAVRFTQSEKLADDFTCIAVRIKIHSGEVEPTICRTASFACDPQALPGFRSWLAQCAGQSSAGLESEDVARLQLACSEVFANCIMHVPEVACGKTVGVSSKCFEHCMTVELRHQGPAFDPLSVDPPSFDGSREGGFGIYIILRSADEARFTRNPDGTNVITLTFLRCTPDRTL